jgi:DNA polymerase
MSTNDRILTKALAQLVMADKFWGLTELPIAPEAWAQSSAQTPPKSRRRTTGASAEEKRSHLEALDNDQVKCCQKCGLHQGRSHTVFGAGSPDARLAFVGEGPGFEEDRQGIPFVGRAGQLLTRMIAAMGLAREDVYICNIVKCRPPNNRDPAADEINACTPYLMEQLRIIDPEVIVALGAPAAKTLLQTAESIGRLRGRFHEFELGSFLSESRTIPLMPTYHPAYLLRSPQEKKKAWEDLQAVMDLLDLPRPPQE